MTLTLKKYLFPISLVVFYCTFIKVYPQQISSVADDFISAINSGNRIELTQFIKYNYDEKILNRIPVERMVSLYMKFFYESVGLGYDKISEPEFENGKISVSYRNNFTNAFVKLNIPFNKDKISGFIDMKLINPENIKQINQSDIISGLESCIDLLEKDDEFSGTILFAKNGNILYENAVGEASKSYKVKNSIETKFNIASVGKIFTAMAIIQLMENNKLSFDDLISKYVDSTWLNPAISSKILIKHLLTHTSGLGDYFKDVYSQCDIQYFKELNDYKYLIADDTLQWEPGTKFSYSNTGYILLGVIIEKITGVEYFDYLKKNIFEPAGMQNTYGFSKDEPVENRATGYTKQFDKEKITWNNHQFTKIMKGSPSGGVYSTSEDLFKFAVALSNGKIIPMKAGNMFMKVILN